MRQDERGDAVAAIRRSIHEVLVRFAHDLGDVAALEPVDEEDQAWRLRPARSDAAAVVWDEAGTDDWAAPLVLGAATEVHVLIDPTLPAEAAGQTVTAIVAAVTAGRFREELWISRRTGRIVAAVGWLRDPGSSRWRAIGNRTRPVPVVRALRHDRRVRDYGAYDLPLWDRLLDALHERSGRLFDGDEAARARQWVATAEGGRLARTYLESDPTSDRERELRARIEAAIGT